MDERERRIGENEVVFRAVNERLEALNETFATVTDRVEIVCECGNASCAQQLTLTTEEYQNVRRDPTQFVIVPGHETASVEEVVTRGADYDVVRKRPGTPAALARETDPRRV